MSGSHLHAGERSSTARGRPLLVGLARLAGLGLVLGLLLGSPAGSTLAAGPVIPMPGRAATPMMVTSTPVGGITVEGTGIVVLVPDEASVGLGVQAQAATAARAQSAASASMSRVINAVTSLGIAGSDIATQSILLAPLYDSGPQASNPPKVIAYQASQSITITVRKLPQTGAVLDAGVAAGATEVDGVTFTVADATAATTQARIAAVNDAKQRAATLAHAAGVTLGTATTITELSGSSISPTVVPSPGVGTATPVQAGTIQVEVDVDVTFAIAN
jgi:uncharacterized protein YggE